MVRSITEAPAGAAIVLIRHQLPVYSPLSLRAVAGAAWACLRHSVAAREEMERALRERHAASAVILADSGTSALTLALRAVTASTPARPVALPAYCCYDVATAAVGADVPVALYDVDPTTLQPDLDSLRRALQHGVGAVVVAHLYGVPIDIESVEAAVVASGAVLIEDAAKGVGGSWNGTALGSFGSLSVLSFGRGKGWTGGGGGALLSHDTVGAGQLSGIQASLGTAPRGVRVTGVLAAQWMLGRPGLYGIPSMIPRLHLGETVYRKPRPQRGMAAASVAALRVGLDATHEEARLRQRMAARWSASLAQARDITAVRTSPRAQPSWLRFPVLTKTEDAWARLSSRAARMLGVVPGYPRTLDDLPGFTSRLRAVRGTLSGARELAARLATLPTHTMLAPRDADAIDRMLLRPGGRAIDG